MVSSPALRKYSTGVYTHQLAADQLVPVLIRRMLVHITRGNCRECTIEELQLSVSLEMVLRCQHIVHEKDLNHHLAEMWRTLWYIVVHQPLRAVMEYPMLSEDYSDVVRRHMAAYSRRTISFGFLKRSAISRMKKMPPCSFEGHRGCRSQRTRAAAQPLKCKMLLLSQKGNTGLSGTGRIPSQCS